MNSSSFVRNFFFKNDADNKLTVNSLRVFAVFVGLIFLFFTIYRYLWWFEPSVFTLFCDFEFAVIAALPACALSLFYSKGFSTISKSDAKTLSVITAIAVATVLILANILLKQSEYIGAIVFAAVCGLAVYFVASRLENVEMPVEGLEQKNHNLLFIIGWVFAFLLPIVGIIIGIYIYTRKDNEYSKVHGSILMAAGIIIWIMSFYVLSLFGYSYV